MTDQEKEIVADAKKEKRVHLTPEEKKEKRTIAAKKTLEKRKAKGIAAKQFFIHKSLFAEAEEIMKPILEKSKALVSGIDV